ncbi:MAG TPA: DUF1836 domain-containing protein [Candidatus Erysipelatoclostridium merdavium]|uniref:DUF1836 domain-containing protein n=1 Tax=Candidatus Erysipelatoclostridium merdavium TaxID=2838566 RepID=A0A9D1XKP4_9FIRM|nr:DUF1836 domain-containing protein [uncultured Thomasclavelia sp.]HIX81212.1 DUF1836 domain-containing protein [Candidatus Erysipelatoclostridium merdavium]
MEQKDFKTIITQSLNKSDLKTQDIPELDLYMDQIMTLFENNLSDNKRFKDDKLLTKTMINNYSKAGVIKPVKGKKYTKEQIIGMLIIYNLKNTITIQEIKQLLSPIYEQDQDLEAIYDQFITLKKTQSEALNTFLNQIISDYDLNLDNHNNRLLTVLALASLSNQITSIIQGIIDNDNLDEDS